MKNYNLEQFPFLNYDPNNRWCYGNMDGDNWFDNVPEGWKDLFYEELTLINEILEKNDWTLRVNQIKEKWGDLEFYYEVFDKDNNYVKYDNLEEFREIRRKYNHLSANTCIKCGSPAKYITKGYILPYCEKCLPKNKNYQLND